MATPFRPEQIIKAPFAEASGPVRRSAPLGPEQLTARAQVLLVERCGPSGESLEAAFAHGAAGLLSGHTHYFDGFAFLMSFHQGTAVAIRETTTGPSMITFEGSDERWLFDAAAPVSEEKAWPAWACLVREVVRQVGAPGAQVEAAVVSTVHAGCTEAYLAALGVAAARAVEALFAVSVSTSALLETVCRIVSACLGLPFSNACLIAAEAGRPSYFTLVDTATGEQLPVEAPIGTQFGWGLVDVGSGRLAKASVHWEYKEKAEKGLEILQKRGFEQLTSFRDLEHRDLARALSVLPRRLKPIVRHLVTQNRRVQRMVFAISKQDWQMLGALLLMSHASVRDDWGRTSDEVDYVVEQVEAMSLDGMYGASVTGRGGCVLIVGKPFVVSGCLERIQAGFEARFGHTPEVRML